MNDRIAIARKVVLAVLAADALVFLGFIVLLGRLDNSRGTPLDPLLWGLAFAAPFVIAALRLRSGPGIDRSLFAQILAWVTAFLLPLSAVFFLRPEKVGSEPYVLLGFCALQLMIPATIRWARQGTRFASAYGRTAVILVAVFVYAYYRM